MKPLSKKTFFCFCVAHLFRFANAQQTHNKISSWGVQGNYGSFLTSSPKARYLRDSYSYFGEVYYQQKVLENTNPKFQPPPEWGAGAFFGNSGSRRYLGNIGGIYSFLYLPVIHSYAYSSKVRVATGLGYVQKPYDKNTNHKNVMIGSYVNAFINFLWQNEYRLSSHLYVNGGISFSHLSNGTSMLPNLSLNIPALSLGLRYCYYNPEWEKLQPESENFFPAKTTSFTFYTTAGAKQHPWIDSKRYIVNTLSAEYGRRYSPKNQYGFGASLFYNRSLVVDPNTITSNKRDISLYQGGVYASFEHFAGNFSIPLQFGFYAFNKDVSPPVYQQVGVRCQVAAHWRAEVMLKTHGGQADFIHVGMGYQL